MRAMVLAAGFGTRLWPLTVDRTKPAVPFLNKPLIAYSVEYLRQFSITELIINLHHQGESIRRLLSNGESYHVQIHYSEEEEILGTSGALDHARHWLEGEIFVVMNGKVITDIDLTAALATHRARGALATLILKENHQRERFSIVRLDNAGNIEGFGGFPDATTPQSTPLMFTGIQILEPEIFDYIPRGRFSHSTTDVYPRAIAEGRIVAAHISNGEWYELSTLARYLDISIQFMRTGRYQDGDHRVVCGAGSVIAAGAQVSESVLWERVQVQTGAKLSQVIVGDDVIIPANTQFERVAIIRRDRCDQIEQGEIIGENLVVPI
ncbi:MAG: NDP-sugar synthase [Acidobacteriota bacterium]